MTLLPEVKAGIVRVRFRSSSSLHSSARFVLHYNTVKPGPSAPPCAGLYFNETASVSSASWHHVAVTAEQINLTDSVLKMYIDGSLKVSLAVPLSLADLSVAGYAGISIGRGDPSRAPPSLGPFSPSYGSYGNELDLHQGAETFWEGGLDELRVWNVSLSSNEISNGLFLNCTSVNDGRNGIRIVPILCFSFDQMNSNVESGSVYFEDQSQWESRHAQSVVGDKYAPWCTTLGDGGVLVDVVSSKNCSLFCMV